MMEAALLGVPYQGRLPDFSAGPGPGGAGGAGGGRGVPVDPEVRRTGWCRAGAGAVTNAAWAWVWGRLEREVLVLNMPGYSGAQWQRAARGPAAAWARRVGFLAGHGQPCLHGEA